MAIGGLHFEGCNSQEQQVHIHEIHRWEQSQIHASNLPGSTIHPVLLLDRVLQRQKRSRKTTKLSRKREIESFSKFRSRNSGKMWEGEFVRHRKFLSKSEEQFSKNSSKTERVGGVRRTYSTSSVSCRCCTHVRTRTVYRYRYTRICLPIPLTKIVDRNITIWQWRHGSWWALLLSYSNLQGNTVPMILLSPEKLSWQKKNLASFHYF
jgi:hypothetical protein